MSRIGEQEILRESKRICRKLLQGCILKKTRRGDYAVTRPAGNPDTARIRVAQDIAEAMQSRGLLTRQVDGFVLSAAGKASYARLMTPGADPYAAQHRDMTEQEISVTTTQKATVAVNTMEAPLSYLHHRHLISDDAYKAGDRLRRDYTLGHMAPRMGVNLTRPIRNGRHAAPGDFSENVLDARDRFRAAMHAAGPEFSGLLYDVCCALTGLESVEKQRHWPRASAKVVLRLALERLARHYGLGTSRSHAPVQSWQAPEIRESLDESHGCQEVVGGEGFEPPTPSV